ncbi:MAG: hypothetical protein JWM95_1053, partial [Gemmatimonadetes bacterium]|nr:hypothetical protein [Gemmatimonadota bacterium]
MRYTVALGDAITEVPLFGATVRDVCAALEGGAKRALRLAAEGTSDIMGHYPKGLEQGARWTLQGVEHRPTTLVLDAVPVHQVIHDHTIVADVPASATAISLFADGLHDALTGDTNSELVDQGMIKSFLGLESIVERVGAVAIRNSREDAPTLRLTKDDFDIIRTFDVSKPVARRVRVAGVLDVIKHSDGAFLIELASGRTLRGQFAERDAAPLTEYWGKVVV